MMSSEYEEPCWLDQPVQSSLDGKKLKISYTREFLLSLSEFDVCKKLPDGFDESTLSEIEVISQEWPRTSGTFPLHGFRRNQYGSSPAMRGDTSNYSRGIHGRWDNQSWVRSYKDGDSQSDWGSDTVSLYTNPSQRGWHASEHDGPLGSCGFPRQSGYVRTELRNLDKEKSEVNPLPTFDESNQTPTRSVGPNHIQWNQSPRSPSIPFTQVRPLDQVSQNQRQTLSLSNLVEYLYLPQRDEVLFPVEPEFSELENPLQVIERMWPSGFHFNPRDIHKTQNFYEFILVDTDSAEITHFPDKNNPQKIAFSKCQIKRVLTLTDWNQSLFTPKPFSLNFSPQYYNYYDYMAAWGNFLYYRNFGHSWFIFFGKSFRSITPHWFKRWFSQYQPPHQILPPEVAQGYEEFIKIVMCPDDQTFFRFSTEFHLGWILAWDYEFHTPSEMSSYREIKRTYGFKWWTRFDVNQAGVTAVRKWLAEHQFIAQKSRVGVALAGAADPVSCLKVLQEAVQALSQKDSEETQEVKVTFAEDTEEVKIIVMG